jgi:hypothetical protein
VSTYDGINNYPTGVGWELLDNGNNTNCGVRISDGTHGVYYAGSALTTGTMHVCCESWTHNNASGSVTYVDAVATHTASTVTVAATLTNTNALTIAGDYAGDYYNAGTIGAVWYWPYALTQAEITAVNTQITTTGFAPSFPALIVTSHDASFSWLAGNPFVNSLDTGNPAQTLALPGGVMGQPFVPGAPYCSSANNGVNASCLTAQQFDGGQ